jgi:hypothetical protein
MLERRGGKWEIIRSIIGASKRTWTVAATLQGREDSQHPALFLRHCLSLLHHTEFYWNTLGFLPGNETFGPLEKHLGRRTGVGDSSKVSPSELAN